MATKEVKDFVVAIEFGSSKVTGIAGKKNSDGSITVLAYAREDSSSFIKRGLVYNIDKTAQGVSSARAWSIILTRQPSVLSTSS